MAHGSPGLGWAGPVPHVFSRSYHPWGCAALMLSDGSSVGADPNHRSVLIACLDMVCVISDQDFPDCLVVMNPPAMQETEETLG